MKKITHMRWIIVSLLALCGCVTPAAHWSGAGGADRGRAALSVGR